MDRSIEKLGLNHIIILDDEVILKYDKKLSDLVVEQIYSQLDYSSYSLTGDLDIDKTHKFTEKLHNRLLESNIEYSEIYNGLYFSYNQSYSKIKDIFNGFEVLTFTDIEKLKDSPLLSKDDYNLFFVDDCFFDCFKGNEYIRELNSLFSKSYFIILTTNENFTYDQENKIMCENSFIIKRYSEDEYLKKIYEIIKLQSLKNFTDKLSQIYGASLAKTRDFFVSLSSKIDYFSDYIFEYLDSEDSSYQEMLISLFGKKLNMEMNKFIYDDEEIMKLVMRQYISWNHQEEYTVINDDLKRELYCIQNSSQANYNINKTYLSVGLGDVFEINDSLYMCIQECDLSLRYDREKDELNRNLDKAILVSLKTIKDDYLGYDIRININGDDYIPSVKNYLLCDLAILDLVSYNDKGVAELCSEFNPTELIEACIGKKKLVRFDEIKEKLNKLFLLKFDQDIFEEFKSQYYINEILDNKIIFNVKRICRVSKIISNKVSILFANDISRIGLDANIYKKFIYQIKFTDETINIKNKTEVFGDIFETYQEKSENVKENYSSQKNIDIECITIHNEKKKHNIKINVKKLIELICDKKIVVEISGDTKADIALIKEKILPSQKSIFFDENGDVKNNFEVELRKIKNSEYSIKDSQNNEIYKLGIEAIYINQKMIKVYSFSK